MEIPLCNSLLFCLIQSDQLGRFAKILCCPGSHFGKAEGKSLTSSNSTSQTNMYFEKQNLAEKSTNVHPHNEPLDE